MDWVKEKTRSANLDRFGVEYASQSSEIKEKVKQTVLIRYGVENVFMSEEVKDKCKLTTLEHYGAELFVKSEYYRENYSGENANNWQGGITAENQIIRNSSVNRDWRNSVFIRDDYVCQCCGKRGGKLNAHHIENFAKNKDFRFNINNGITICYECHHVVIKGSFHNTYGNKNNNYKQLKEYMEQRKGGEWNWQYINQIFLAQTQKALIAQ